MTRAAQEGSSLGRTFHELGEQLLSHRTASTSALRSKPAGDHEVQPSHFRDEGTEPKGGEGTYCGLHIYSWTPGPVIFPLFTPGFLGQMASGPAKIPVSLLQCRVVMEKVPVHTGTTFPSPLASTWAM